MLYMYVHFDSIEFLCELLPAQSLASAPLVGTVEETLPGRLFGVVGRLRWDPEAGDSAADVREYSPPEI